VDQFFDKCGLWRRFRVGFWGGCVRTGFGRKERGDDLQVVEHLAGTIHVQVVGRDAAEQVRRDDEGRGAVLDDGEEEWFL